MTINDYPKSAYGIHKQQWIHDDQELMDLIAESNGQCSVFVSHNSYPSMDEQTHGINGTHVCPDLATTNWVQVNLLYFDLDDPRKIEHAHADCRKIIWRAETEGWRWWAAFSGKKGFQFIIDMEPETHDINGKVPLPDGSEVRWSAFYRAVHVWLAHECDKCDIEHPRGANLRTLDFQCAEPKHIMRVWNTQHFSRKSSNPTGTYCIPLTIDQVLNLKTSEIIELAKNPVTEFDDYWNRAPNKRRLTFTQFCEEYQISTKILTPAGGFGEKMINPYQPSSQRGWLEFLSLWPNFPCLANEMFNSQEPRHMARFASLAVLKQRSDDPRNDFYIDEDWVCDFYENQGYIDFNERTTRLQARSILERGPISFHASRPVYIVPSCSTLFANGLCIGPVKEQGKYACEKFPRFMRTIDMNYDLVDGRWVKDKELENDGSIR